MWNNQWTGSIVSDEDAAEIRMEWQRIKKEKGTLRELAEKFPQYSYSTCLAVVHGKIKASAPGPIDDESRIMRRKPKDGKPYHRVLNQEIADYIYYDCQRLTTPRVIELVKEKYGVEITKSAAGMARVGQTWRRRVKVDMRRARP